jgi:hypothetical protein
MYEPTVGVFADWLVESGFSMLVADQLGDQLAEAKQAQEDEAYVRADEIMNVVSDWDLYQGRRVDAEQVRAWLSQVESNLEQRLLYKLLQNLRFVRDPEVREQFSFAHSWIRSRLPVIVKTSRSQRRDDVMVAYVDADGKSGAYYAGIYANANDIVSDNVTSASEINRAVERKGADSLRGVVVVDDVIGTGNNLIERLSELSECLKTLGIGTKIPLSVVVLCATGAGERRVRRHIGDSLPNSDLEVCESLERKHYAFGDTVGFWASAEGMAAAKALLTNLGARVQKRKPLGFGDQGLLLTFARNCPNNSLPILHRAGKGSSPWVPLFPRMRT